MDRESAHPQAPSEMPGTDAEGRNGQNKDTGSLKLGGEYLKENRPDFRDIKSFEEFSKYYWYREELSQICKSLGLEYRNTKQKLNYIIEQYLNEIRVEKSARKVNKNQPEVVTLKAPIYEFPTEKDRG